MSGISSKKTTEDAFLMAWHVLGDPNDMPMRELHFALGSKRKWRFDFAWVDCRVAVEIEGGTFAGGRHNTGAGHFTDCDKYNEAVERGWALLRFTAQHLRKDLVKESIERVRRVLGMRR